MRDDSWRQYIQSHGRDFEVNKKGSPILELEEIFPVQLLLKRDFEAEIIEVFLAYSIRVFPLSAGLCQLSNIQNKRNT